MRGRELSHWSNDVYLSVALAGAVIAGERGLTDVRDVPPEVVADAPIVAALAAWRMTQGIYRFDAHVRAALWETPVEGELPTDLLRRLPEWCVYVETPDQRWREAVLHGFFAHLDLTPDDAHGLALVLDTEGGLLPLPLPFVGGGLHESLAHWLGDAPHDGAGWLLAQVTPLVSLLLYLCSINAEVRDAAGTARQPVKPQPTKTRKGLREFAPDRPTEWEVAYRLGAALRHAAAQEREPSGEGTHARPRPHIRRAHWHSFWTGKLSQPQTRRLQVRWMPPVAVALTDTDELVPVIHPVK